MLDREIGLARPNPQRAARKPAARKARVKRERTIRQRQHGTNVLAEQGQHEGGVGKDARVVLRDLERLSG